MYSHVQNCVQYHSLRCPAGSRWPKGKECPAGLRRCFRNTDHSREQYRTSTVMRHGADFVLNMKRLPALALAIAAHLQMQASELEDNFDGLREVVRTYLEAAKRYQGGHRERHHSTGKNETTPMTVATSGKEKAKANARKRKVETERQSEGETTE
eukprot:4589642-Amphidinium_carterae.1